MRKITSAKKMQPSKVYYKNKFFAKKDEKNKNKNDLLDGQQKYSNILNKCGYSYPIAIYKEPTLFDQYKGRLIMSKKSKEKKSLLNKYYHHIYFNSHLNDLNLNNNNSYTNLKFKTYKNKDNEEENKIYNTFYKKEKNTPNIKIKKNLSSYPLFNYDLNNKIYQQIYLSEIRN